MPRERASFNFLNLFNILGHPFSRSHFLPFLLSSQTPRSLSRRSRPSFKHSLRSQQTAFHQRGSPEDTKAKSASLRLSRIVANLFFRRRRTSRVRPPPPIARRVRKRGRRKAFCGVFGPLGGSCAAAAIAFALATLTPFSLSS